MVCLPLFFFISQIQEEWKRQQGGLCSQIDLCRVHQMDEAGQGSAQAPQYAWHTHLSCIGLCISPCQNAVLAPIPAASLFTQHLGLKKEEGGGEYKGKKKRKHRHKMAATVTALSFEWVEKEEEAVLLMFCEEREDATFRGAFFIDVEAMPGWSCFIFLRWCLLYILLKPFNGD